MKIHAAARLVAAKAPLNSHYTYLIDTITKILKESKPKIKKKKISDGQGEETTFTNKYGAVGSFELTIGFWSEEGMKKPVFTASGKVKLEGFEFEIDAEVRDATALMTSVAKQARTAWNKMGKHKFTAKASVGYSDILNNLNHLHHELTRLKAP